jgi:hypothetical protein
MPLYAISRRVSRYKCHSALSEMDIEVDINTDLYPLQIGDRFKLALASTLDPRGRPDDGTYGADFLSMKGSLMDRYDYVMHGKIYKVRTKRGGYERVCSHVRGCVCHGEHRPRIKVDLPSSSLPIPSPSSLLPCVTL